MKILEYDIEQSILDYLRVKRIFAWKNETQGTYDPKKKVHRLIKSKKTGLSDILGIYNKKFLAIEVKTPDKMKVLKNAIKAYVLLKRKGIHDNEKFWKKSHKRYIEQYRFILETRKNGGIGFFSCSVKHTIKTLNKHS